MKKTIRLFCLSLVVIAFLLVGVGCPPASDESYGVAFDSQGGSAVASQTVATGEKVTKPTDPTRDNFTFGGWFKEAECKTAWKFDTDTVSGAIILYAKWTPKTVVDVAIKSIAIKKAATRTTFSIGEDFSSRGLVVEATLTDDTKKDLNASDISIDSSAYKKDIAGTYSIVITLKSNDTISISYDAIVDKVVTSIAIGVDSPHPTVFVSGDDFSYEGLIIVKTYDDGTTAIADPSEYFEGNEGWIQAPPTDSATQGMEFYLYSDKDYVMSASYAVTIYAPSALEANAIFIKTPALKLSFAKGDAFSSEGLVIEKTTALFGDRKIQMAESEYGVTSTYDTAVATTYEITIAAIAGSGTCTYSVEVIDISGATVSSIRIKAGSNHQTELFKGEAYNSLGLIVEKVLSNDSVFVLLEAEYDILDTAYTATALGSYDITIELIADRSKQVTYSVTVVDPSYLGVYYGIHEPATEQHRLLTQMLEFEIKDDGMIYFYEERTLSSVGELLSITRSGNIYTLDSNSVQLFYDVITKRFFDQDRDFFALKSTDIVLPVESVGASLLFSFLYPVCVVPNGGSIEQRFIDGFSSLGKLYKNGERADLVTSSTQFSEVVTLHVLADLVNYEGKPFLGKYFTDSKVIFEFTKDKCLLSDQPPIDYTAIDNADGTYTIEVSLMGMSLHYTVATSLLSFTDDPTISIFKVDSSHAIVTLTTTNESWSEFGGEYAVKKGDTFNTLLRDPPGRLTITGYIEGTPINDDSSYEIASAVKLFDVVHIYGTYAKNFTLHYGNKIDLNVAGTLSSGTYKFIDNVGSDVIDVEMEIGGQKIIATITKVSDLSNPDNPYMAIYTLEIQGAVHPGNYKADDETFYQELPFIGVYNGKGLNSGDMLIMNGDGRFNLLFDGSWKSISESYSILSFTGSVYTLSVENGGFQIVYDTTDVDSITANGRVFTRVGL